MDSFSFYYNDCDVELFPKEVTEQIRDLIYASNSKISLSNNKRRVSINKNQNISNEEKKNLTNNLNRIKPNTNNNKTEILYIDIKCLNEITTIINDHLSKNQAWSDYLLRKEIKNIIDLSPYKDASFNDEILLKFKKFIEKYLKRKTCFFENTFANFRLEVYNNKEQIVINNRKNEKKTKKSNLNTNEKTLLKLQIKLKENKEAIKTKKQLNNILAETNALAKQKMKFDIQKAELDKQKEQAFQARLSSFTGRK